MAVKKTYIVAVREVHVSFVEVVAESSDQAIDIVDAGDDVVNEVALEYSHTMPRDTWTVEEKNAQ